MNIALILNDRQYKEFVPMSDIIAMYPIEKI